MEGLDLDFIGYSVALLAAGITLGWHLSTRHHIQIFGDLLDALGVSPDELEKLKFDDDLDETTVAITVEKVGNNLYAYTKENPKFLAQGQTREELLKSLGEKLIDATVIIHEDDEGYEIMQTTESAAEAS